MVEKGDDFKIFLLQCFRVKINFIIMVRLNEIAFLFLMPKL